MIDYQTGTHRDKLYTKLSELALHLPRVLLNYGAMYDSNLRTDGKTEFLYIKNVNKMSFSQSNAVIFMTCKKNIVKLFLLVF